MATASRLKHADLILSVAGDAAVKAVRDFRHQVGLFDYQGSHPRWVIRDLAAERVAAARGQQADCLFAGDDEAQAKREYERLRAVFVGRMALNALRAAEALEQIDLGESAW